MPLLSRKTENTIEIHAKDANTHTCILTQRHVHTGTVGRERINIYFSVGVQLKKKNNGFSLAVFWRGSFCRPLTIYLVGARIV